MTAKNNESKRRPWGKGALCATTATLAALGCGAETAPISETLSAVTANPGSTINKSTEANDLSGQFPEVMVAAGGCTGTVVGPYAVLTANHCVTPGASPDSVWWTNPGASFGSTYNYINPYLRAEYTPDWWVQLNNQAMGAGGWPAQHDLALQFVPGLTPAFIQQNKLRPWAVSPPNDVGTSFFTLVGTGSTGGSLRDSIAAGFQPASAGTITGFPRDGYLTRSAAANYGYADGGDSGGPTVFSNLFLWFDGSWWFNRRYVVGTAQNVGPGGDLAPLAYDPGITMTPNQRLTVRLNSMWARARIDDIDGDGLPTDCDAFPADATDHGSLCPAPIGAPTGQATREVPSGQLECKPGYVPAGLRGRAGVQVDQLAVLCRAVSCYYRPEACGDSYWTDEFGGTGGAAWTETCAEKSILTGINGRDLVGSTFVSVGPTCATYLDVTAANTTRTSLPAHGSATLGTVYNRNCAAGQILKGFQARTSDKRYVTGLQQICSADPFRYTTYRGGAGGGVSAPTCPSGMVGIGAVTRAEGSSINVFGLLCGDAATVKAGNAVTDAKAMLAHGGYLHFESGLGQPDAVEPKVGAHVPADVTVSRCPNGYALSGINTHTDTLLNRINSMTCRRIRAPTGATTTPAINIGTASGAQNQDSCPGSLVSNGVVMRTGWLADGLALHCVAP